MKTALILSVALLAGCASYRPIVDTRGVDMNRYETDLAGCQQYADQVSPAGHALVGAAAGAGLAAILAAVSGGRIDSGSSARMSGVLGAAAGGGHGAEAQVNVIRNCMRGRGYSVLQ